MADIQVKTNNGWKSLTSLHAKINSGWVTITEGYAKTTDGWKKVWPNETPFREPCFLKQFNLPSEANGLYVADEIRDGVPYYQGNPVIV